MIQNNSKEESDARDLKLQLTIGGNTVTREINIAGAEKWGVNKLYPLGSKIMVKYDPLHNHNLVMAESVPAHILNGYGYAILGICSIVFILLVKAEPRMFCLGMGRAVTHMDRQNSKQS